MCAIKDKIWIKCLFKTFVQLPPPSISLYNETMLYSIRYSSYCFDYWGETDFYEMAGQFADIVSHGVWLI
jgi:hypothetical protein